MKKKSFALLEVGNSECPPFGVIANVSNDESGKADFKKRFIDAVGSHFDADDFNFDEIPDLFDGGHSYEVGIEIDGFNYSVEIVETWIY